MSLRNGKLPHAILRDFLGKYTNASSDPRVLNSPALGDDAAVIDMGVYCIVSKMDPITMAIENLGYYVVNINANDVVTKGAEPRWFQVTLLFPEETEKQDIERVFYDIKKTCEELGVSIIGGHTEVTPVVKQPVAIGNMMGEVLKQPLVTEAKPGVVEKEHLIQSTKVQEGDDVIILKGIGIEGTASIASERPNVLKDKGFNDDFITRCKAYLRAPGINASTPAIAAFKAGKIHAMHDPTEGGLGNALNELSELTGFGFKLYKDRIRVYPETQQLCEALGLDPMYLLSSGSMIIIAPPEETIKVVRAIRNLKLDAAVVGSVVNKNEGIYFMQSGEKIPMKGYQEDEIIKVL
nr:AIR synthase-related protein [Candidatus Sigynarchaeota archaeon]